MGGERGVEMREEGAGGGGCKRCVRKQRFSSQNKPPEAPSPYVKAARFCVYAHLSAR